MKVLDDVIAAYHAGPCVLDVFVFYCLCETLAFFVLSESSESFRCHLPSVADDDENRHGCGGLTCIS